MLESKSMARMINKVPQVTFLFWVIKIMATTVGETGADFLAFNLHLGITLTCALMSVICLFALLGQVGAKKYVPAIYWTAVVLISIVGTLITDNLVDNAGVPLKTTTISFSVALIVTFFLWYKTEKTLSIHTIFTVRRELFYWAAILFTFALGTAAGDLFAERMGLGYLVSALIFGGLIAVITIAHYFLKLDAVTAFWLAYILTRPFGASCGDFLSQPERYGGLGLGTISTSIVFLMIILGLVVYLTVEQKRS